MIDMLAEVRAFLPGFLVVVGAPVALSLFAIVIGSSPRPWPLRAAAILGLLWGLYPAGIWSPLVIAASALPILVFVVSWIKPQYATEEALASVPQHSPDSVWRIPQYSLGEMLIAMGAVSVWLALVTSIWPRCELISPLIVLTAALTWVTLAALAFAAAYRRKGWLYLALLVPLAFGLSATLLFSAAVAGNATRAAAGSTSDIGGLIAAFAWPVANSPDLPFWTMYWLEIAIVTYLGCVVIRARSHAHSASRRWIASAVLGAAVAAVSFPLVYVYIAMVQPFPPMPPEITGPNALPSLVELGAQLEALGPSPTVSPVPPPPARDAATQERIQGLLAAVEKLAEQPGYVPVDDKDISLWSELGDSIRPMVRRCASEARAISAADPDAAGRLALAGLGIGAQLQRNGLLFHLVSGVSFERVGILEIVHVRAQLGDEMRRQVIKRIAQVDADREPLSSIVARDLAWCDRHVGWPERLGNTLSQLQGRPDDGSPFRYEKVVHTRDAYLRLLALDLAIRCYQMQQGEFPVALSQLTPAILDSLPLDPFSGDDFVYKRSAAGFVLYSVGPDGQDNRGQFGKHSDFLPSFPPATPQPLDLDLETILR